MKGMREHIIQAAIVALARMVISPSRGFVFAIPNGAHLKGGKAAAGKLLEEGMLPGMPDLGLVMFGGKIHWIEVKTPKDPITGKKAGSLSSEQVHCHNMLRALGHEVDIIRDVTEAASLFRRLGLTNR